MSSIAVKLDNVSKKYRLFDSSIDRVKEALDPRRRCYHHDFWALRDVSFDVSSGKTLGVLGLNGSGKSTLLQLVAGVLQPTQGTVKVSGKVAALLELGAGFNPELTGRENVVTNAILLGLSKRDALEKIDEVRAFADVGQHFDQPVKTYSSGMFMRVAFAVSICVNPDILIIDEALAVGDAKFQEKCFRRLKMFQAEGRTILFVTHDRGSVTQLCDEAILLYQGQLISYGEPKGVVDDYTQLIVSGKLPDQLHRKFWRLSADPASDVVSEASPELDFVTNASELDRLSQNPLYNKNEQRWGNGGARVIDALVVFGDAQNPASIGSGDTIDVLIRVAFDSDFAAPLIGLTLSNHQGVTVYSTHNGWLDRPAAPAAKGDIRTYRFRLKLPLAAGAWFAELAVARHQTEVSDVRSRVLHFEIYRKGMVQGLVDLEAHFEELPASHVPAKTIGDPPSAS